MEIHSFGPYILTGCPHCGEIYRVKSHNGDALAEMMVMHLRSAWECRKFVNLKDIFHKHMNFANVQELERIFQEDAQHLLIIYFGDK
jgi:hypothetical protein